MTVRAEIEGNIVKVFVERGERTFNVSYTSGDAETKRQAIDALFEHASGFSKADIDAAIAEARGLIP
jgi:hypothetical protein